MFDAITDVQGIEVGQRQDLRVLTGCSVVLCREGGVVGVDVRGPAPGTRETDLCRPGALVEKAQAVLLTGGSAFGLEAAAGVMRFLWERGIGYDVGMTVVPIVPGAVIFDLGIGLVGWPDAAMGYEACMQASAGDVAQGCVGAGTGATVGKFRSSARPTKSGVGTASLRVGSMTVGALVVVNARGSVILPGTDTIIAGGLDPETDDFVDVREPARNHRAPDSSPSLTNTTIGVVATDAILSKAQSNHLASIAHDGLARAVQPVHTMTEGDTMFSLATGRVEGGPEAQFTLEVAVSEVVQRSIVKAVANATAAGGLSVGRLPSNAATWLSQGTSD